MAGMGGMDPAVGHSPRPPPFVRKGHEKDAGRKAKKRKERTNREQVTGPNNPLLTIPTGVGVPEGIPKGLEVR